MMQPPMTPPGGGGLPPEILQALMAENPGMAMDPGMAPDAMTPEDELAMMGAEQGMAPEGDPMSMLTGMAPGAPMPSTDPNQIAAILADMQARDVASLEQRQQMERMQFMADQEQAAMLAIQAVRDMQANSGMTATSPHEGFDSGIGQPPGDMIA